MIIYLIKMVLKVFPLLNHVLTNKYNQTYVSLIIVQESIPEANNTETIVTSSSKHSQYDTSHIRLFQMHQNIITSSLPAFIQGDKHNNYLSNPLLNKCHL